MKKNNLVECGVGEKTVAILLILLQLNLIAFKLFGLVTWSWWVVLFPILLPAAITLLMFIAIWLFFKLIL